MAKPNAISADFSAIVAVREVKHVLDTRLLFDADHDDSLISPIDQFIENTLRLNKMWVSKDANTVLESELGILLLLGYVSAVESYMRAMIRRLVAIDPFSQKHCENLQLSFAAAVHHKAPMLPEALLEESVFSGKKGITGGLLKFLDVDAKSSKALNRLLEQYDLVCELRHCCVHRFGKLGAKNAVVLGMASHKEFLEKPLSIKAGAMGTIADLLFIVVKSINNEVFSAVMKRTATSLIAGQKGIGWTWNKAKDRRLFGQYYTIFYTKRDAQASPPQAELYERFRGVFHKVKA